MANIFHNPFLIGFLMDPSYFVYTTAVELNAANDWAAISFIAPSTEILYSVSRQISSITGTLGVSDLTCSLYSDTAGEPGTKLQTSSIVAGEPAANDWLEFIGFTYTITQGTRYWLVFKNTNGSPATNYPTYKSFLGAASYAQYVNDENSALWGHASGISTDGGSTWTMDVAGEVGTCLIKFGDGNILGLGVTAQSAGLEAADAVYGARQVGAKFISPKGPVLNVTAVTLPVLKHGSPTVNPMVKIYEHDVLVASSFEVPSTNIPTDVLDYTYFMLRENLLVQPGTPLRVVLAEPTNSDANTDYYAIPHLEVRDSDPILDSKPMNGSLQHCEWDGYIWTDTPTSIVPFGLALDITTPFYEEDEIPEVSFDFSEEGNSQYLPLI